MYCIKDEVIYVVCFLSEIVLSFKFKEDVIFIFEIEICREFEFDYFISVEYVGKSFDGNIDEYMVDINKEERFRKVLKNRLLSGILVFLNDVDMVNEYYMVLVGVLLIVDLLYFFIFIWF